MADKKTQSADDAHENAERPQGQKPENNKGRDDSDGRITDDSHQDSHPIGNRHHSGDVNGRSNTSGHQNSGEKIHGRYRHVHDASMPGSSNYSGSNHYGFSGYVNNRQYGDGGCGAASQRSSTKLHQQAYSNPSLFRAHDDLAVPKPLLDQNIFHGPSFPSGSYDEMPPCFSTHQTNAFPDFQSKSTLPSSSRSAPLVPGYMVPQHVTGEHGLGISYAPIAASSASQFKAVETENTDISSNSMATMIVPTAFTPDPSSSASPVGGGNLLRGYVPVFTPIASSTSGNLEDELEVEIKPLSAPSSRTVSAQRSNEVTPKAAEAVIAASSAAPPKTIVSPNDIIALLRDDALTQLQSLDSNVSSSLLRTLETAQARHIALTTAVAAKQERFAAELITLSAQEQNHERHMIALYDRFLHKMTKAIDPAHAGEKEALQRDAIQAITIAKQLSTASMACRAESEACRLKLQNATDSIARSSAHLSDVVFGVVVEGLARHNASPKNEEVETPTIEEAVAEPVVEVPLVEKVAKPASGDRKKNRKKTGKNKKSRGLANKADGKTEEG